MDTYYYTADLRTDDGSTQVLFGAKFEAPNDLEAKYLAWADAVKFEPVERIARLEVKRFTDEV